jgi:glycosyltransferase involved in cell wall biosynthesis
VDRDEFRVMDQRACRQQLGLPQDKKIVLFAGSLEKVKGLRYLLEAWEQLAAGGKALLVLVGDGSRKAAVLASLEKRGLRGSVLVQGAKPCAEVPVWMNAADAVCLPSIREGYPNVLLEAIACGKYTVATAVGGIPEIITSSATGLLVPPGDSGTLAGALRQALARPCGAPVTGQVRSWKTAAGDRLELFHAVLRRQNGAQHRREALLKWI